MRNLLPISVSAILTILTLLITVHFSQIQAAPVSHVVLSEIQIEGTNSTDEFVELYNPTSDSASVAGWTLYRKTAALDAEEQVVATLSGSIQPHGFLLIAHNGYDGLVAEDVTYDSGFHITDNNTLLLKNQSGTIIDLVGMGSSNTSETAPIAPNPVDNRSIERKAMVTSTAEDMRNAHSLLGNGEDTDNNANDFVRHLSPNVSDPQNSSSPAEVPTDVTPTQSPTESPTPTTEPTGELTPTSTPMPTNTPTPTTEPTEEPTPTIEPTEEPTPTEEPAMSPTPTVQPSVTPEPFRRVVGFFPLSNKVCYLEYKTMKFGFYRFFWPTLKCETFER
jgi:hypothetical protein